MASQEFKKGQEQIPHFRHAFLKLALSETGAITPATARKMFARDCEKKVLEGNQVLSELRELVAKAGVDIAL